MIVDGKAIAGRIYDDLASRIRSLKNPPRLTVFTCAPNLETRTYLELKKKRAESVGVAVTIIECAADETTDSLIAQINTAASMSEGIIVQLPLPSHIDTEAVLASVPPSHDIDGLGPETEDVLPPVVGACKEILKVHEVPVYQKHVVILGSGRLVGKPAARWFAEQGASVSILTRDTIDVAYYTAQADIIVCGAGDPGFLKPEMVKEGVVILDAGTSEDGGVLRGDADPACAEKASLFTPVPGGIGPITVAVLLRNLVDLTSKR